MIDSSFFDSYGWKEANKKEIFVDEKFWIFQGRKKENSPFNND